MWDCPLQPSVETARSQAWIQIRKQGRWAADALSQATEGSSGEFEAGVCRSENCGRSARLTEAHFGDAPHRSSPFKTLTRTECYGCQEEGHEEEEEGHQEEGQEVGPPEGRSRPCGARPSNESGRGSALPDPVLFLVRTQGPWARAGTGLACHGAGNGQLGCGAANRSRPGWQPVVSAGAGRAARRRRATSGRPRRPSRPRAACLR